MTEPVLIRELEQIRDAMTEGFHGVHDRLDLINGRLRTAEATSEVLEDRSERTERHLTALDERYTALQTKGCAVGQLLHGSRWTPKRTAGVAVGGSAVALGLIELGKLIVQTWK